MYLLDWTPGAEEMHISSSSAHWSIVDYYIYYIDIRLHTWSEFLVPLVNMIKEGCGNKSALLIILIYYLKKLQKSNILLENKNLKWGDNIMK